MYLKTYCLIDDDVRELLVDKVMHDGRKIKDVYLSIENLIDLKIGCVRTKYKLFISQKYLLDFQERRKNKKENFQFKEKFGKKKNEN